MPSVENGQIVAVMRGFTLATGKLSLAGHRCVGLAQKLRDRGFVLGFCLEQQVFQDDHRRGVVPGIDQSAAPGPLILMRPPQLRRAQERREGQRDTHNHRRDSLTHDDPCPAGLEVGPANRRTVQVRPTEAPLEVSRNPEGEIPSVTSLERPPTTPAGDDQSLQPRDLVGSRRVQTRGSARRREALVTIDRESLFERGVCS